MEIMEICDEVVELAAKNKVEADIMVKTSSNTSFSCRGLKPESLISSDEMSITFRIIKDKKCVTMVGNDKQDLGRLMSKALKMLSVVTEDPFARIISANEVKNIEYQPTKGIERPSIEFLKEKAFAIEGHALKQDKVKNVGEANCTFGESKVSLVTSSGFRGGYSKNIFSLGIEVITEDNGEMSSGYDYSVSTNAQNLKDPISLAESASMRSKWGLGAKKIPSCTVPVIFEKRIANDILESLMGAINGDAVSKQMSFAKDSLHKKICSDKISIIDDPLRKDWAFSAPFDGEGFATQKVALIKDGILNSWILDIRSAEKLKLHSTGHGYRSGSGTIKPSTYSTYLETKDNISKESMIADIKNGLYVTEAFSFGYNSTTGDYSKGVSGFWIEDGKITYPVNEITIASNLAEMLSTMILANDLTFDYQMNSPTIFIPKMVVSGK